MDRDFRRELRAAPPASEGPELLGLVLKAERGGLPGIGTCSACAGRQVLLYDLDSVLDCPRCFGSGAQLTRAHLELLAYAGDLELREELGHARCGTACWCAPPTKLHQLLNGLRAGWGLPAALVALPALGTPATGSQPALYRLDPECMQIANAALDWIEDQLDVLELVFGATGWVAIFDLLEATWIEGAGPPFCGPAQGRSLAAVRAWARTGLGPASSAEDDAGG